MILYGLKNTDPKQLMNVSYLKVLRKLFRILLTAGEIPNMLLSGPPGIGKTTVAKALCNELGADYYVINGSDEGRFLDTVRNEREELRIYRLSYKRVET